MSGGTRLMRLIGDGGGGLPLPLAFGSVVEHLLDHGSARFGELEKLLAHKLAFKETRILSTGWRTWADFTQDILDQISGVDDDAVPILFGHEGQYFVLPAFQSGVEYVAIKQAHIMFTVYSEADRLRRDKESRVKMDLRGAASDMRARLDKYVNDDDIPQKARELIAQANKNLLKAMALVGEPEEETAPVRDMAGSVKPLRGSKASAIPIGPLGWSRGWLKGHPGEWRSLGDLRDLYAREFNIVGMVSGGSIGKGLAEDAAHPDNPLQRREVPGKGRVLVQYAWPEVS